MTSNYISNRDYKFIQRDHIEISKDNLIIPYVDLYIFVFLRFLPNSFFSLHVTEWCSDTEVIFHVERKQINKLRGP